MMFRVIVIILGLASIAACTQNSTDSSKKKLTQHERDSVLAESDLPGAGVVGKTIEVSDSTTARVKRLDEQSD